MEVVRTPTGLHAWRESVRRKPGRTGLVPTMGSLHAGHLSLLEAARRDCDRVVMSLFLNPAQFDSRDDLDRYPGNEERDLDLAAKAGVDLVYCPSAGEMYPPGFATTVTVDGLTGVLCGRDGSRGPGHFAGVTTVVAKLFNAVDPDRAYFGQKDAQQAVVIRRMVTDLEFRTEIVVLPTVREADGLAMSSRNLRLSNEDRNRAAGISAALFETAAVAAERGLDAGLAAGREHLSRSGIQPEYFEARDPETLEPAGSGPALVAIAARVGGVRLIDNVLIEPKQIARSNR